MTTVTWNWCPALARSTIGAHAFSENGDGAYHNSAVDAHRCFKVIFESLAGFAQDDETRRKLLGVSQEESWLVLYKCWSPVNVITG